MRRSRFAVVAALLAAVVIVIVVLLSGCGTASKSGPATSSSPADVFVGKLNDYTTGLYGKKFVVDAGGRAAALAMGRQVCERIAAGESWSKAVRDLTYDGATYADPNGEFGLAAVADGSLCPIGN